MDQINLVEPYALTADDQKVFIATVIKVATSEANIHSYTADNNSDLQKAIMRFKRTMDSSFLADQAEGVPNSSQVRAELSKLSLAAEEQTLLRNVELYCKTTDCDGKSDIFPAGSALEKTQRVIKINKAIKAVKVEWKGFVFAYKNAYVTQNVYASLTVYPDTYNPFNAIDSNSRGTVDCHVYTEDADGKVISLDLSASKYPINITLAVNGTEKGIVSFYNETSQQLQKVANCTNTT